MRRGLALLSLFSLARCSLLVGDFEIPTCRAKSDCETLNAGLGACERYVCVRASGRCVRSVDGDGDGEARVGCGGNDCDDGDARRSSRQSEVCDGVDNNCNEVIDDGRIAASQVTTAVSMTDLGATMVSTLRVSGSAARGALSWTGDASARGRIGLIDATGVVSGVASPAFFQHASSDLGQPLVLTAGCAGAGTCIPAELALDDIDGGGDWFAAAVNTAGCAAGDLRVGYLRTTGPQAGGFIAAGPRARGAAHQGFGPCVGAMGVRVSRLRERTTIPRALVGWNARDRVASRCGAVAPVELIGLYLEGASGAIPWVNTTQAGSSQRLGMTASDSPPAIASYHRAGEDLGFGWFTAWGGEDVAVHLRYVPRFEDAPAFSAALPPETPRASPALDLSGTEVRVTTTGTPQSVGLAVGESRPDGVALGLSWIDGCEQGRVWFARVRFVPGAGTFQADVPVAMSAGMGASPAIRWLEDGFVTGNFSVGSERAGEGSTGRRGGWLVTWVEGNRIMGRRVGALSSTPLDDAPVVLREGAGVGPLVLGASGDGRTAPGFWFNSSNRAIERTQILCGG